MANLQIKHYNGPKDQETICIPGCGACCFYKTDEGIYVRKNEVEVIDQLYGPLRQDNELIKKNNQDLSRRQRKNPIAGLLPNKEGEFSNVYGRLFGEVFSSRNPKTSVCEYLSGLHPDGKNALLSEEEWSILSKVIEKSIGEKLNLSYPQEGFEGVMCGKYKSVGPARRGQYNCSFSLKMMPKIIRNHGVKPLEEMLNEHTLAKRFLIASEWLYKPKSL